MDAVMTKNFEDRYLDLLESGINKLEVAIAANSKTTDEILAQAKHTNGRVTKLEARATALEKEKGKKLSIPPNVIYIIAVSVLVLLIIIAGSMGIDVRNVL